MSLPPGCAQEILKVTLTRPPFLPNMTAPERAIIVGQTLAQKEFTGGECGIIFDNIEPATENYTKKSGFDWDDINDDLYDLCIEPNQPPKSQRDALTALAYFSTAIIMLGMGCNIDIRRCFNHLKRPWGVLIGVVCQFIFMPAIALGLAKAFQGQDKLTDYQALAILLLGCSPGGSLSNLMSVWIDADTDLSVTMTLVSSFMSLGTIPLFLHIFTPVISDKDIAIPFVDIVKTLATLITPLSAGIALAYFERTKKFAEKIQKITGLLGLAAIIANIVLAFIMYPEAKDYLIWELWIVGLLVPIMGAILGYFLAWIMGHWSPCINNEEFSHKQFRTVSLETGCQNLRLPNTIVQVSFISCPAAIKQMIFFPLVYAIFQTVECLLVAVAWKIYKRFYGSDSLEVNERKSGEDNPNFSLE